MKKLYIDDIEKLACVMIDFSDEYSDVSVFCKYDIARKLIAELIKNNIGIMYLDIAEPSWNMYDKEYEVSIVQNQIFCYRAYDFENKNYLTCETGIALIHEDCNCKIIDSIRSDFSYEFALYCDGDCDSCKCNDAFYDDYNDIDDDYVNSKEYFSKINEADSKEDVRHDDDDISAFTKSWTTNDDGVYHSHSYSFYSNNRDDVDFVRDRFYELFGF